MFIKKKKPFQNQFERSSLKEQHLLAIFFSRCYFTIHREMKKKSLDKCVTPTFQLISSSWVQELYGRKLCKRRKEGAWSKIVLKFQQRRHIFNKNGEERKNEKNKRQKDK